MNSFTQTLILTIIDKLAIGFLIVFAGYLFNRTPRKVQVGTK